MLAGDVEGATAAPFENVGRTLTGTAAGSGGLVA
jgi:hypothetical protein